MSSWTLNEKMNWEQMNQNGDDDKVAEQNSNMTDPRTEYKKDDKPPAVTAFVPLGGGKEEKMGGLIFKAGRELLESKIKKSAQGIPTTGYTEAEHLEKLSEMFPITNKYNPITLRKRIKSYMTAAREHVRNEGRTGQGKTGNQIALQEYQQEEIIINLLNDARNSITPPKAPAKVFFGADTRYEPTRGGSGATMDLTGDSDNDNGGCDRLQLEEKISCCACLEQKPVLQTTLAGYLCIECLDSSVSVELEGIGGSQANQANISPVVLKIREEESSSENKAQIAQHAALMDMDMEDGKGGLDSSNQENGENKSKPRKSLRRYDVEPQEADENDDKIGKALERNLMRSEKKMDMEEVKIALEVKKLKKDDIKGDLEIQKLRLELMIKQKEFDGK